MTGGGVRLVCLNGWGGTLGEALVDWIATTAPDVLCLQEVVHTPDCPDPWATYRDGNHILPQRANLYTEVARALPHHSATFCPAARGVLWQGDRAIPSYWGLATYIGPRLIVTAQAQGFVHKRFSAHGYGDHPRSRSAHALRLFVPGSDRHLSVTQMHGLRDPAGKHDTPARDAQARRFLALSDQVSEPGDIRILCGDFNVGPDSRTLALLAAASFTELVTARGHPGTRTSQYRKPGRFADYMLIDQPQAMVTFDVIRSPEVSDHCPMLLTL
jgi:endonuclease/exonuclease/phosphatase family metal-dependent hydrolase